MYAAVLCMKIIPVSLGGGILNYHYGRMHSSEMMGEKIKKYKVVLLTKVLYSDRHIALGIFLKS